jgi:phosphonate transport system substrate-binding protein
MNCCAQLQVGLHAVLVALTCLLMAPAAIAQAKPKAEYSLAVSEGTSGGTSPQEIIDRYKNVADMLSIATAGRVIVVPVRSFAELESGMKAARYDFVLARPSDYPARGVRDNGYRLVSTARPDGQCLIVAHKDSTIKSIANVKGKSIILPEKVAYMTRFCTAELRDQGINVDMEKTKYAKEQAAIAWSVQNKLADIAGVASYSGVGRNPGKSDLVVVHKSRPQPYLPLIAGKKFSASDVMTIQSVMRTWETTETGKETLKTLGIEGFNYESPDRLKALLVWLEKK